MNGAQELLQASHRCTCALQAGRGPDRWRQDLQQQTTRIKALSQQCHWIATVAKVQMKLQDQPLWGSCLPSLTGGSDRPTETRPPVTRSRPVPSVQQALSSPSAEPDCPPLKRFPRRSPTEPQRTERLALSTTPKEPQTELTPCSAYEPLRLPTQASADLLSTNPKEPQTELTPCSAHEPLRLPTQASADLLQCLVQKPAPAKTFPEPICEPKLQGASTPDIPPRQRFSPIVPTPQSPKPFHDICLDSTNQKRWRQQLIQRSNDSLRSRSQYLNTPVSQRLQQKNPIEPLAVEESLSHSERESSSNPWLCSLGTTAPLDLLTDLVTLRSTISSSHDHTSEPEPQRRSLPAHEPRFLPKQQDPEQVTIPSHSAIAPWQNTQTRPPLETLSQLSEPTQKHKAAAEPERIDPPAVAPTLPPLVASQTGEDSPSVTTPLIQQRAQQEAVPEVDLDGLASQIKRILDEEARRYGINV